MRSAMACPIAWVDMARDFMGPAPGSFPAVPPGLVQFRFRGADCPAPARPQAAAPEPVPESAQGASTGTGTRRQPCSVSELPAAPGCITPLEARRSLSPLFPHRRLPPAGPARGDWPPTATSLHTTLARLCLTASETRLALLALFPFPLRPQGNSTRPVPVRSLAPAYATHCSLPNRPS